MTALRFSPSVRHYPLNLKPAQVYFRLTDLIAKNLFKQAIFSLTKIVPFLIFKIALMKEVKAKQIRQRVRKESFAKQGLPFSSINYWLFAVGLGVIISGYVALAQPPAEGFMSLTVAPVLLVIGYCVIIPAAILYKKKSLEPTNGKEL